MADTKSVAPLLTTSDQSHVSQNKTTNKPTRCKIYIVTILFLTCVLLTILLLYYLEVWPFQQKTPTDIPIGLYGKFPTWGGNMQNQQTTPSNVAHLINKDNIKMINAYEPHCIYNSYGSHYNYGFTVIDDNDYAYISDGSGFVTSINLTNNCSELWRVNIGAVLGFNFSQPNEFISRNGMSIYMNKQSIKSLIIGTPNRGYGDGSCWIFALNTNNGELLWKLDIRKVYNKQVTMDNKEYLNISNCEIHGFMIDEQYAFGGLIANPSRGRFMKIDLEKHVLVDTFYTISSNIYDAYIADDIVNNNHYTDVSPWNWPAIIDDYVIFGTGNLYNMPAYIEDCIMNNNISYLKYANYSIDACGNDMSQLYTRWQCAEEGVYDDSFNILKHKNTGTDKFEHIKSIPLIGIDVFNADCNIWLCRFVPHLGDCPSNEWSCPFSLNATGTDSDIVAVAAYRNYENGKIYGAGLCKSGIFYVFDIITGDLIISKKIGISSDVGGGEWSLAVSEKSLIAIATIVGGETGAKYKSILANNKSVCNSGVVHAIDLRTGYTLWQSPNPYAVMNDSCDNINDTTHPKNYDNYIDYSVEFYGVCERDVNGNEMKSAHETAFQNVTYINLDSVVKHTNISDLYNRAKYFGPVVISNDMVFVPSYTGDVFIHDLFTGHYIHRLQCVDYWDNNTLQWNRPGIHGGVTVSDKFIIFYCGAGYVDAAIGNQVTVFKIQN
eukprot:176192_1